MRGFLITFLIVFLNNNQTFGQKYEDYQVKPIAINNRDNNSGVSFFRQNYLIYTLEKKDENIHDTDFYVALADETGVVFDGDLLDGGLNSYISEVDVVFTTDFKKAYFTRSYIGNDKKVHYDIYVADVSEDNKFTNIKTLPINYKRYSTAYPCLSKDNNTLYFTSNRKESLGGFDIFKVAILEGGKRFGKVINLGKNVNTKDDEITPYVINNELFFSSNGRGGLGKQDVFVVNTDLKTDARNLGETLNSSDNDYKYIRKPYRGYGFLVSDRVRGKGKDDIYFFRATEIEPPVVEVVENEIEVESEEANNENKIEEEETIVKTREVVKNNKIDKPIVQIKKENETVIDNSTKAEKEIDQSKAEQIIIDKSNQIVIAKNDEVKQEKEPEYEEEIIYKEKKEFAENIYDYQRREVYNTRKEEVGRIRKLKKTLTKKERICVDKIEKLKDIYFDLNKFNIRPDAQIQVNKAIHIMEKCPNLKFVASSFTDSRGSSEYNRKLSQRRADSVVRYILANSNLSPNRVMGVGYGESGLKNRCYNGVKCSEKEHQINRRTEIEVSIKK